MTLKEIWIYCKSGFKDLDVFLLLESGLICNWCRVAIRGICYKGILLVKNCWVFFIWDFVYISEKNIAELLFEHYTEKTSFYYCLTADCTSAIRPSKL